MSSFKLSQPFPISSLLSTLSDHLVSPSYLLISHRQSIRKRSLESVELTIKFTMRFSTRRVDTKADIRCSGGVRRRWQPFSELQHRPSQLGLILVSFENCCDNLVSSPELSESWQSVALPQIHALPFRQASTKEKLWRFQCARGRREERECEKTWLGKASEREKAQCNGRR